MPVTHTYDIETAIGLVRFLIGDHPKDDVQTYQWQYSDEELQAMLSLSKNNVYLASANLLDKIALSETKAWTSVKVLDISLSGGTASSALKDYAKSLREQSKDVGELEVKSFWLEGGHESTMSEWRLS